MTYNVILTKDARKSLDKINLNDRDRIYAKIKQLAFDPRPPRCKKLSGNLYGKWRIRVGDFRVVYTIEDRKLVVIVIDVDDRKDIYK